MTDWAPQIVKIEKIEKHAGADNLSIATVLGDFPVIVKTGQFNEGDIAGYIPIDSIVPDTDEFYFLCPKKYENYEEDGVVKQRQLGPKFPIGSVPEKYRIIKAKRIRGTYSQGMLIESQACLMHDLTSSGFSPGQSIVDLLGLKKWEEPEEENLPGLKNKGKNAAKPPEGWAIPYYDVDGIRKYLACLGENEEIVLTEKVHGSNAAFCHDGTNLWVKSRNFYKKMDQDDMWWDVAIRYDLATKLAKFPMHVFFGEIYGQVKGFKYDAEITDGRLMPKVRFFDIWDVKAMRYLDYDPFVAMVQEAGLDLMTELYRGPWLGKDKLYPFAEGMTTLGGKHIREGWVLRTAKERYEPRLDSRMQVKLVGEAYNLQK